MSQNNQETEVKLHVPDLGTIQRYLESLGATLKAPRVFERNIRYENAQHSLTPNGIVIRLREDSKIRLTYKGPRAIRNGIGIREELEVEVSDADTMAQILERFGYRPHMTYEKYRTTYMFKGAEIVLDELPYGSFIEIEADIPTIETILRDLHLASVTRIPISYVSLFEVIKERLKLKFQDLTFDNFAALNLPESVFEDLPDLHLE